MDKDYAHGGTSASKAACHMAKTLWNMVGVTGVFPGSIWNFWEVWEASNDKQHKKLWRLHITP